MTRHKLALRLYDESQITVKCVIVGADQTKQQPRSASGSQIGTAEETKQPSSRLTPAAAIKDVFLNCCCAVAIQADSPRANRANALNIELRRWPFVRPPCRKLPFPFPSGAPPRAPCIRQTRKRERHGASGWHSSDRGRATLSRQPVIAPDQLNQRSAWDGPAFGTFPTSPTTQSMSVHGGKADSQPTSRKRRF